MASFIIRGEQSEILLERFAVYTSAFDWTCATPGNTKKQAVVLKCVFHFLSAGWHLKRCYLTPQAEREQLCLHFRVYIFPWKRAASGKDPLCSAPLLFPAPRSGRALQHPRTAGQAVASCSHPGQQPGALAEGASSRVQVSFMSPRLA